MAQRNDPETLKIPAYMRAKAIVQRDRQRLLWTAWDRKEAGVKPNSPRALGKVEKTTFPSTGPVVPGRTRNSYPHKPTERRALQHSSTAFLRPRPIPKIQITPNETAFDSLQTPTRPQKFPRAGQTTHYLPNINVAIIKTTLPVKIGDVLLMEGDGFVFSQPVTEMQIDRKPVKRAKKGSHIGLKVEYEAAVNGSVYLLN